MSLRSRLRRPVPMNLGGVLVLIAALAAAFAVAGIAVIKERTIEKRIPIIREIGSPCRTAVRHDGFPEGLLNLVCARQSDLIIWSYCLRHRLDIEECPELPPQLRLRRDLRVGPSGGGDRLGSGPPPGGGLPGGDGPPTGASIEPAPAESEPIAGGDEGGGGSEDGDQNPPLPPDGGGAPQPPQPPQDQPPDQQPPGGGGVLPDVVDQIEGAADQAVEAACGVTADSPPLCGESPGE